MAYMKMMRLLRHVMRVSDKNAWINIGFSPSPRRVPRLSNGGSYSEHPHSRLGYRTPEEFAEIQENGADMQGQFNQNFAEPAV